ncbi:cytochrome P450 [Aspergillus candidus]|uniref:Cytochrome P450 n=1 Tax=Aspergillus candidus TaxID=41067 RepID=A0A2I2F8D2_ASPCN|nr:cytochrome P450 [Aspergillus candidus]PLB36896.1 cytochrome P450 [Aspergillus candidus]
MAAYTAGSSLVTAAVAGALSHILYFSRGEHQLYGSAYFKTAWVGVTAAISALHYTQNAEWSEATSTVAQIFGSYLAGVYGHLIFYRLFLHPLSHFPGPVGARISSLYSIQYRHQNTQNLVKLHHKYGPIVRNGSSDLSIVHPKAVEAIYGPKSRCSKAEFYDFAAPNFSLQTYRDYDSHHRRRRVWSTAFSDKLIRGYEQRVRVYQDKLIAHLASMNGQPVDWRKWSNLYSFDVMGDLAFGKGFGSMEAGEEHWVVSTIIGTMDSFGLFLPTWLMRVFTNIPGLSSDWWRLLAWCSERFQERMSNKLEIQDISSTLIAALGDKKPTKDDWDLLTGDSRLIVVAGSDTTAGTFVIMLHTLLKHPAELEKLRAELEPFRDASGHFLNSDIANLDHLNGVINETLRMYPPVSGVLPRMTPPEGIDIDGMHIPGNVTVSCPMYPMGRSEMNYEKPNDFIPERWYKNPELIKHKEAFAPFTIGEYNCIGRPVALLNLRTTLARLVTDFDIQLAPGETGEKTFKDSRDSFVIYWGELNLVFNQRK